MRASAGAKGPAATTSEHAWSHTAAGAGAGRCAHSCCARMHSPVGLVPRTATTCAAFLNAHARTHAQGVKKREGGECVIPCMTLRFLLDPASDDPV